MHLSEQEKDAEILVQKNKMKEYTENLHALTQQRKETQAQVVERNKEIDRTIAEDVIEKRGRESRKRMKINAAVEQNLQELTSELMLELMQICAKDEVPAYIVAIAKILDNFLGKIQLQLIVTFY